MTIHLDGNLDHLDTWVFDLDNTLYPASCDLFAQIDQRMGAFLSEFLGVDAVEARRVQKLYYHEYGTTLRGLMLRHGMHPDRFLDYVHEIDHSPVCQDPALDLALERLAGRKLIFTNGSVRHAERVIARLGVERHFPDIFDIVAAGYIPKPDADTYRRMVARHGIDPRASAMFEDLPRNLAPAARLGMTTVLVVPEPASGFQAVPVGEDGAFIHHITHDLAAWLGAVIAQRVASGSIQDA